MGSTASHRQIFIEVKTTDADKLRNTLNNTPFPIQISTQLNISEANITTVCSQDDTGIQCLCEDDHLWPCDKCATYGKCDSNTTSTCGCITAVPKDGQYCQSVHHQNFPICNVSTTSPSPTTPPVVDEYVISIELNTTDVAVIELLRNIHYPINIIDNVQVSDLNISTVCSPRSGGYQCRCEDQYRWPCDQCVMYISCDNITEDTCGCINTIPPDGQYCQPPDQFNVTVCSMTTTTSPTTTPTVHTTTPTTSTNSTTTLTPSPTTNTTNSTTAVTTISTTTTTKSTTTVTPPTTSTTPTVVYEYMISIELNTTDVVVIELLRNIHYPINIIDNVQVSDLNITTVCSPRSGGYQCRCEDQYRWPCDQCVMYISCDNITEDTCGCINTIPPDGQYCQPPDQFNVTVCSMTTTTSPTTTPTVHTTTPTTSTNSTTTLTPSPTTNTTNSTTAVTTISTTTTTKSTTTVTPPTTSTNLSTTVTPPTTNATQFNVLMSVELNKTYTKELNDSSSPAYKELESEINKVLEDEYKGITGFSRVSVIGFRNGSIFADFIIQTTHVISDEVGIANTNLPEAIESIAPVIGQVTALVKSETPISVPNLTYTGKPMSMMCTISDNLNVGTISSSCWTFNRKKINRSERITILTSGVTSTLTINKVILLDIGVYECFLTGQIISFSQNGDVQTNIKQAPIIRLQNKINVECKVGKKQSITCCVQLPYEIKWFRNSAELKSDITTNEEENCIKYDYMLNSCSESQPINFICKVDNPFYEKKTEMNIFREAAACNDDLYGAGREDDISTIRCEKGQEGFKTAHCVSVTWILLVDTCILTEINELFINSMDLDPANVEDFVAKLNMTVRKEQTEIVKSSATISAIVDIIGNIAAVNGEVSESVIKGVLETVDVIISDDSRESWTFLNQNDTNNSSSNLLSALEGLAGGLVGEVSFASKRILLNRTTFNNSFTADLNSTITIDLPNTNFINVFITTITFPTLNNVMPVRNTLDASLFNATSNETVIDNAINGAVVLVQINATIPNVTLSYNKLNKSLSEVPQCVFWNFSLFNNRGAWDDDGCRFVSDINNTVTCFCNHLTSFSILMSTDIPPPELREALDIITYVGVAISLASLVICLIIEGYVWKAVTRNITAFMRHVSIINTAVSLLIADICFIIGASLAKNPLENPGEDYEVPVGPCSTATFFMHFFYLALLFWMLVSGLLLFYRTVMVFSHMSRSTMLGIGFLLGYGCPLIIAVITVAVTAPGKEYIRKDNACWLNWFETHALLALVIPALIIVSINIIIVIVVLFKMLRRGVGDAAQRDERHTLLVILRCVVILTPLFGLTWSLGIGTMISSTNKGIHIAFAFFNSLQGFFILVFGTLFDSKIRSILSRKFQTSSTGSNNTRTTSGGISSYSGLNWINRLRRRRNIYQISETANSNTNASESFTNI
ncbi:adhesion G protein-coupled receptor F5-like isoform X2 [Cyclopterus lumpus]|uniref:adhesion G protein-coupled receptor F5-like isoform X2 n=1 Tax=Cyclopterus lumpus TaxID=8103 RepID=UPI001486E325|nr:adhesion G protein-coupled receptor F5-like isoform X2 [Cyclopterus lumpus]